MILVSYLLEFLSHILKPYPTPFAPGHPMCDCIATSNNIAQRRQDYGHPTYAAYVDLHTAFDSLSQSLLWLQQTRLWIPDKIVSLIRALYRNSASYVSASQSESAWFVIKSGVRQGCSDGGTGV